MPSSTCVSRSHASHSCARRGDTISPHATVRYLGPSSIPLLAYLKRHNLPPPQVCSHLYSTARFHLFFGPWRDLAVTKSRSPLLTLAPNAAARLLAIAPTPPPHPCLLWCDVNEAFCFVIKRWPLDTERLINQDERAGEG